MISNSLFHIHTQMSHLQKTVDTLEKNCCIISQKSDNNSTITQEIHTRTVEVFIYSKQHVIVVCPLH